MKKSELIYKTEEFKNETAEALKTIIESITAQGQRKKLLKNEKVIELLDRYNLTIEESNK